MDSPDLTDTLTCSNRHLAMWILLAILLAILCACSTSQEYIPTIVPSATPIPEQVSVLNVLLGSTAMAMGENRLFFALVDADAEPIKQDSVALSFVYQDSSEMSSSEMVSAVFRQWPYDRGVYTAQVLFDKAGTWRMDVGLQLQGQTLAANTLVQVARKSRSPAVGSRPPSSHSKTLGDVVRLEELTTDPMPDEELYSMTIAEALQSGKSLVVTFATPGFCLSAACGPQVEVVKEVKERYSGRVNFIHVEVFDNPAEMREDARNGRLSPVMVEWGLESEPYTFVIDALGNISAKFEGFSTAEELDEAIKETLS